MEIVPAPSSEIYQNLGPQIMGAGLRPPLLPPKNAGKNQFVLISYVFFKFLIEILLYYIKFKQKNVSHAEVDLFCLQICMLRKS